MEQDFRTLMEPSRSDQSRQAREFAVGSLRLDSLG
jgi:hypothetical protein